MNNITMDFSHHGKAIKPLADRLRPDSLELVAGQKDILSKGKILRNIIESGNIPNMIFYGPSGTGKTTVANIAATMCNRPLYRLNATNASVGDIKNIISELDGLFTRQGVLLYLDEIQNFNKKQQQSLLEYTENGQITLIASTTENPYFYIYNALLSRCTVFEFRPLEASDIIEVLQNAAEHLRHHEFNGSTLTIEDGVFEHFAQKANGDARRAINSLELASLYGVKDKHGGITIDMQTAEQCTQSKALKYDKDSHYDILSALHKSIRGSDPNAAVHYLARLLLAGDLPSVCRRLMCIAAEDVGLAYPLAVTITKSCVDCALQLGMPEARLPLAEAAIMLASAPKSNSAYLAIDNAIADVTNIDTGNIPRCLQNKHYDGVGAKEVGQNYKYPHDYPASYVKQQYLPDNIKDKQYYIPGNNKLENQANEYLNKLKNNKA